MPISRKNPNYTVDLRKGFPHNLIVTNQFVNKLVGQKSLRYKKVTSCECWQEDYDGKKQCFEQVLFSESVKNT